MIAVAELSTLFMSNPELFYLSAAVVGMCIGSFLNVVIYRLPTMLNNDWYGQCLIFFNDQLQARPKELRRQCPACLHTHNQPLVLATPTTAKVSLVAPSSCCPQCHQPISWRDNIPLLSYLWLRGHCRFCNVKISSRYPLVELVCAIFTPLLLWHFGFTVAFAGGLMLSYAMLVMVIIDYDWQIIPDDLTLPLLWLGLLFNIGGTYCQLNDAVIGAVAGYLSLWLVYQSFRLITGKEGMGYGDFKLLAVFGAWLGWQMLPIVVLLSSLVGTVIGLGLLLRRGQSLPFAFGPFLALGGMISFLYGEELVQWYLKML